MNIPRLLVGGFLALGIVGISADAAQAQYYGANNYNNRFSGGSNFNSYSGRSFYASPGYSGGYGYNQPYYGQFYGAPPTRSFYNYNYNRGYNYTPYQYNSGSSFQFNFGRVRR